jgi:hypothetical protein
LNRSYLATALSTYGKEKDAAKPPDKGRRKPRSAGKRGGRPIKYGEVFVDRLLKPVPKVLEIKGGSTTRVVQTPLRS